MPEFYSVAPVFAVADVGTTIRWYEEQLGFIGDPFPAHEPYVFAIVYRDKIEIMLQRVEGYQKPDLYNSRAGGVWDAYFRIEGVKVADTLEGEVWTGRLEMTGESERSIRDALESAAESSGDRSATSEAGDWLRDYLVSVGGSADSAPPTGR